MKTEAPLLRVNTHPTWFYRRGAVRWRRATARDVRKDDRGQYEPVNEMLGWLRRVHKCTSHPIDGTVFAVPQYWISETKL